MKRFIVITLILFLALMIVPQVSAELTTLDNWHTYDETTKTATIKDLTGDIGQARLRTAQNQLVARGYGKVAEFDLWAFEDYKTVFKGMKFQDINDNNKLIQKEFDYKLKVVTEKNRTLYKTIINGTNNYGFDTGYQVEDGIETYLETTWKILTPADLKKNDAVTIGIFTTVEKGDSIEWIPNIMGEEITEWASFTESMKAGLRIHYNMNEATGYVLDSTDINNNATNFGCVNSSGLIGSGYQCLATDNDNMISSANTGISGDSNFTMNMWIKADNVAGNTEYFFTIGDNTGGNDAGLVRLQDPTNKLYFHGNANDFQTDEVMAGTGWQMLSLTHDGTTIRIYINGTLADGGSAAKAMNIVDSSWYIMRKVNDANHANGTIDLASLWNRTLDASEIIEIYNGGAGQDFAAGSTDNPPEVTLNTPANDTTLTVTDSFVADCTVSDDIKLDNVTFALDGGSLVVNTSGFNNSIYTNTYSDLSVGVHNWSCQGEDNSTQTTIDTRTITYTPTAPTVTTFLPVQDSTVSNPTQNFVCFNTVDAGLQNVSLIINDTIVSTNTTGINNTNYTFNYALTGGNGAYGYNCQATSVLGIQANGTEKTFSLQNDIRVVLKDPIDYLNTSTANQDFIGFASDDTTIVNVSLVLNTVIVETNTSGINASNYTFNNNLIEGVNTWNIQACDNLAACATGVLRTATLDTTAPVIVANITAATQTIYNYGDNVTINYGMTEISKDTCWYNYAGSNNTFSCDTTQFNVSSQQGFTDITLYANDTVGLTATPVLLSFSYDTVIPVINITLPQVIQTFATSPFTEKFNFTAVDTNLDVCWYDYDDTNTTIGCTLNTTFVVGNNRNITLWANDTLGNTAVTTRSWSYTFFLESETHDTTSTEGSQSSFFINVLTDGNSLTSAILNYSGTAYTANIGVSGSNNTINRTITVPGVSGETNQTFYWNITNVNGISQVVYTNNQTVSDFLVDNCSVQTYLLYNFTIVSEAAQQILNGTLENTTVDLDLNIYDSTRSSLLQGINASYPTENPIAICLSTALAGGEEFNLDLQLQYDAGIYAAEFYNIQKEPLTSADLGTNITLYDLLDADAQEFKLTYKDSNFKGVSNALVMVQRKYISEGVFKAVEIAKTDENGETIVHLALSDVIYTFIIVKDGSVLGTFSNVLAVCDNIATGDCTINLNSFGSATTPKSFASVDDYSFTFNKDKTTREVSATFVVTTGSPTNNLLNVTLFDGFGTREVCNDILVSSSGTLSCTIPSSFGNSTVIATLSQGGEIAGQAIMEFNPDPKEVYGTNRVFIALFMVLTLIGIGVVRSPMMMGATLILGMIVITAFHLTTQTTVLLAGSTAMWFIVAVVIVIIKLGRSG